MLSTAIVGCGKHIKLEKHEASPDSKLLRVVNLMGVASEVIARPFPGRPYDRTLSQELLDISPVRKDLCGKEARAASTLSFRLSR